MDQSLPLQIFVITEWPGSTCNHPRRGALEAGHRQHRELRDNHRPLLGRADAVPRSLRPACVSSRTFYRGASTHFVQPPGLRRTPHQIRTHPLGAPQATPRSSGCPASTKPIGLGAGSSASRSSCRCCFSQRSSAPVSAAWPWRSTRAALHRQSPIALALTEKGRRWKRARRCASYR